MIAKVHLALVAVVILAMISPAQASTFNVNGSNGWTDGWGDGTPNYATDVFTGGAYALSGNAALVYDHVEGDPGRGVDQIFASPLTGQVDVKFNLYIPGANNGAFFIAYYMTDATEADLTNWGAAYIQTDNAWIEDWEYGFEHPILARDVWQEIKFSLDFTAGTAQYFLNGTPVGDPKNLADGSNPTQFLGFGLPFKESYMGTPFTGPVYLDDFSVVHNGTTVWSENFDSYIAVPEPGVLSLTAIAGVAGLLAYAWRKRRS